MRSSLLLFASALTLSFPVAAQAQTTQGGKEALDILSEAIAVPTVKDRGQVPVLADKLTARLVAGGFAASDVKFVPMGETGYLTARYPGRNAAAKPVVMLVHMDVVEALAKDWERDPFTPVVEDGFVFGRGSTDNKGDLAMIMAALFKLKRERWVPARDLILLVTGDEETAMATTAAAAEVLANAELVLNGDGGGGALDPEGKPTVYSIQAAEKTYADIRLTATDPGGHSSAPDDSNPVTSVSAALAKIGAYRFPAQLSPLTKSFWTNAAETAPADVAADMRAFAANADKDAADRLSDRPEYIGMVRTTCVPTMVNGGHAPNALPQSATANVNCRIFPGTSRAEITRQLEALVGDPAVKFELIEDGSIESPESPLREDVMAALRRAIAERAPGVPIVPSMSAGATDSMFFRALGIPSFGVSAIFMRPEDEFAHGLNERLPVATLDPGVRQWETLLRTLLK